MKFEDLKKMYCEMEKQYGEEAPKHISSLLEQAKQKHLKQAKQKHEEEFPEQGKPEGDHGQSWRAFKGKNLEKLILYIVEREVKKMGLEVVPGEKLEKAKKLSCGLSRVKRNLVVDYGEFGRHLPDVDIVVYNPNDNRVVAIISSKVTLRERVAQTGYWKLKLGQDEATKHIKVYLVTPDEDGTLTKRDPAKKGRAIVEKDLDGTYVMTTADLEESDKVKLFEHFVDDLRKTLQDYGKETPQIDRG